MNQLVKDIISTINIDLLTKLKNQFSKESDGLTKYFNYEFEVDYKLQIYSDLSIELKSKKNILDISCGMSYFGFICRYMGHNVTVTDENQHIYDVVRSSVFGFNKIEFKYDNSRFKCLPCDIGTFDIITALSVAPMSWWSLTEWKNFIYDCLDHINKGGFLYIRPNRCKNFDDLKLNVNSFNVKTEITNDRIKVFK